MNEEELKATIGETAFNAMSAEQKTALLGKVVKPAPATPEPKKDDPAPEPDLRKKVQKEKDDAEAEKSKMKTIENSLSFNVSIGQFVKDNADVLPEEISEILKRAEKEKYDTAGEKASAIKTAFIESFFSVQANVDALTPKQKSQLDDYLKLTKNGKDQKAESIYENIFEPALESLKRVKKVEELGKARSGIVSGSKVEDGYKNRLMEASRKKYLNEKGA